MTFKTIQVYMDDSDLADKRLKVGLDLATKLDAHIGGLHVIPPAVYPTYFAAEIPPHMLDQQQAAVRAVADRAQARFDKLAAPSGRPYEWRLAEMPFGDVARGMTECARYADLNVFGQVDPEADDSHSVDVAGTVLLGSGRPVLMVPYAGEIETMGEKILVAWNASRESTRAVFEAIPLLKMARDVTVLAAESGDTDEAGDPLPGTDIATTLARHDVKAEIQYTRAADVSVGDAILNHVSDNGSDLLVMGAYGHSRLRETIFGGVTRDILQHMTVPVFMSH